MRRTIALSLFTSFLGCSGAEDDGLGVTTEGAQAADYGPSEEDNVTDRCRSQCELAAGECMEQPLDSFPDFEATEQAFSARCSTYLESGFPFLVEGRCADGKRLLQFGGGYTSERRLFAGSKFVALTTATDAIDEQCEGKGYWPKRVPCADAVVTRVLCGDLFGVGDRLDR